MDIKRIVEALTKKHNSNNPFVIAKNLHIILLYPNLINTLGYFSEYKRSKFIHINHNVPDELKQFICAHELGHSILHPGVNTPFLKRNTFVPVSGIEREAHIFAVELLLPDSFLAEYSECDLYNIASKLGIPKNLARLKSRN